MSTTSGATGKRTTNFDDDTLVHLDTEGPSTGLLRRSGGSHTASPLSGSRGRAPEEAASGCCGMSKAGSIAFAAYLTTTIALAIIGMLVCTGVLDISFVNVGPMTPDMGLYLMIAGLSAAVIGIISLMIAKCRCNRQQVEDPQATTSPRRDQDLLTKAAEEGEEASSSSEDWSTKWTQWKAEAAKNHEARMKRMSDWWEGLGKNIEFFG